MAAASKSLGITAAFGQALLEESEFTGAISFHRAYPAAPNPGLVLSDLGPIGLPLNPREAQTIKTRVERAPSDMGERTIIDPSAEDTWQMDANMVNFVNPSWIVWLECIIKDVCRTLGVNYVASKPRCELYKLLLYGKGSHFLPHVDTEKVDGMFATIVIVLPSEFAGGAAHLSHGSMSAVYDCSVVSDIQTSVMAWYTGMMQEIKPITGGYRLALSYNLVHTTTALRPALSAHDEIVGKLRDSLLVWNACVGSASPVRILYLLKHEYSEDNLRGSALRGPDAHHTALLDMLGKELGFHLGLANVECYIEGTADDDRGGCKRHNHWYGEEEWLIGDDDDDDDEEESIDEDDLDFADISTQSMTITNFVDLSGRDISAELDVDGDTETIPTDLEKSITSGAHDEQDYEGYSKDYGAGMLERWYFRTVLVIWPDYADFLMTGGDFNVEDVFIELTQEVDSVETSFSKLRTRAEFILNRFSNTEHAVIVADAVCGAARKWSDIELWKRAVDICSVHSGLETLDANDICCAIKVFGFEAVRLSLETMVQRELHNKRLFAFLDQLRVFSCEDVDEDEDDHGAAHVIDGLRTEEVVAAWIEDQWSAALKALRKPTTDEFPILFQLALDNGGLAYLRDSVLPQIAALADATLLREFATYVMKDLAFGADSEAPLKHALVSQSLEAAISKLTIMPVSKPAYSASYPYAFPHIPPEPSTPDPSLALAKSYFETCLALQCPDLVRGIVGKVADTSGQSATDAHMRAKVLMLPFLIYVADSLIKHPGIVALPELVILQKAAITPIVDSMATNPKTISREEVGRLLDTVYLPGGPDMFVASILPKLDKLTTWEVSAKAFLEEFHSRLNRISLPPSYQGPPLTELVTNMAKTYAKLANINTCEAIITAIDCCIRVQALNSIWPVLNRVLDTNTLKRQVYPIDRWAPHYRYDASGSRDGLGTYADKVVVPLVGQLRTLALKYNMLDALSPAFRMIIRAFIQKILGPAPVVDLTNRLTAIFQWTCACQHCPQIRAFLLFSPLQTIALERINANKRKHIEASLRQHVTHEGATWQTIYGNPQGIRVKKTKLLSDYTLWQVNQKTAVQLVRDVSPNEEERKRILGDDYVKFAIWTKGLPAVAEQCALPASASRSTATPGTSGVRRPAQAVQALPPAKRFKNPGPY